AQFGGTTCSVLDPRPCALTVCPLDGEPCQPQYLFPLGENLQVTIDSAQWHKRERIDTEHKIDNIRQLFAALRAPCLPPDRRGAGHDDLQLLVRFAFRRNGERIGEPRVTYTTPGLEDDTRKAFRRAITEALDRCTPMPFSKGMGGAIAGRPIAIRYVDKRTKQDREHQP